MNRKSSAPERQTERGRAIPLFAGRPSHPFVPLKGQEAIARSVGPGRPSGRCLGTLPWTDASTVAVLRSVGRRVSVLAAALTAVSLPNCVVRAETMPAIMPSEHPTTAEPFGDFIAEASQRFGIPTAWIRAVIQVESAGDAHALSPKGAMGLMQIMPETWDDLRVRFGLGIDPYDPRGNILAGSAYLREMYDRFGTSGFLVAYNAGPARYQAHLVTGQALPDETQRYVAMVMPMIRDAQAGGTFVATSIASDPRSWRHAPLFIATSASRELGAGGDPVSSDSGRDRPTPSTSPTPHSTLSSIIDLSAIMPRSDGLFVRGVPAETAP